MIEKKALSCTQDYVFMCGKSGIEIAQWSEAREGNNLELLMT